MTEKNRISVEYFSDVLCVWAYAAEARVEELLTNFRDEVQLQRRYFPVFGDTAHKIGRGWAQRGAWDGFADHVQEVGERFDHIELHPDLWRTVRPPSSTGSHLLLVAAQLAEVQGELSPGAADRLSWALRLAFFRDGQDIADWRVLGKIAGDADLSMDPIREAINSGRAYAALNADDRDREAYRIEGSPTFVLNEGRQKLYGNVGYRIIEANLRELIREPQTGAASWC
ncbi:MAG: DsbA family protein [Gammaproteobacteria bacterium]|nr:DsbA family protein [Gammaproteobacteria bacterium]